MITGDLSARGILTQLALGEAAVPKRVPRFGQTTSGPACIERVTWVESISREPTWATNERRTGSVSDATALSTPRCSSLHAAACLHAAFAGMPPPPNPPELAGPRRQEARPCRVTRVARKGGGFPGRREEGDHRKHHSLPEASGREGSKTRLPGRSKGASTELS